MTRDLPAAQSSVIIVSIGPDTYFEVDCPECHRVAREPVRTSAVKEPVFGCRCGAGFELVAIPANLDTGGD